MRTRRGQEPRKITKTGTKEENKTGTKDENKDGNQEREQGHELRMRIRTGTKDENNDRDLG